MATDAPGSELGVDVIHGVSLKKDIAGAWEKL